MKNSLGKTVGLLLTLVFLGFNVPSGPQEETLKQEEIFLQLFRGIQTHYVDSVPPEGLIRAASDAMLKYLDPYSYFVSASEQEANQKSWKGVFFSGIGVNLMLLDSNFVITEIKKGYPAGDAGLRAGDRILSVDEKKLSSFPMDSVVKWLRGEPGKMATVEISRNNQTRNLKIQRREITSKAVPFSWRLNDSTGYLQLTHFLEGSALALKTHTEKLRNEGCKYFVVDLRGNSGGLVDEAVRAVNVFLPKGKNVFSYQGRAPEWKGDNLTYQEPLDTLCPLLILIDGGTISAGEIFAGAIQDHDRGLIAGRKSFGKGFVQGTRMLPYGNTFYMTSARYHTPSGRCIQELDYRKKDEKGNPVKLSVSPQKTFYTGKGRPVKESGGIVPDILIEERKINACIRDLKKSNILVRFLLEMVYLMDSSSFSALAAGDSMTASFIRFAESFEPGYALGGEENFQIFSASLKEDGRAEALGKRLDELKKTISDLKSRELFVNKDLVKKELEKELALIKSGYEGKMEKNLKYDEDLSKSILQLLNRKKYLQILSGH